MQLIDITDDPWHWRFLKFMGKRNKILYYEHLQNTCGYVRTFIQSVLFLVFLTAVVFLAAANITFNIIVGGIFAYHLGFFAQLPNMIVQSMPELLGAFCMATFALLAVILFVGAIVAGAMVSGLLVGGYFKCTRVGAIRDVREKFKSTSTYQIASAWHNKICRPIKTH
jgi:hypothetical protein